MTQKVGKPAKVIQMPNGIKEKMIEGSRKGWSLFL
jgi:hypothetical protein